MRFEKGKVTGFQGGEEPVASVVARRFDGHGGVAASF